MVEEVTKEFETTNGAGTWDFLRTTEFPYHYYTTKTITAEPHFGSPEKHGPWGDGYWNRIGIHNPGIVFYASDYLPLITKPFVLSFFAEDGKEAKKIAGVLRQHKLNPKWVEWNTSCPNIKSDLSDLGVSYRVNEMVKAFEPWPVAVKVSPFAEPRMITRMAENGAHRIVMCNSLETPKGGLSGPPIHSLVAELIREVRTGQQCPVPITALGGVKSLQDGERIDLYLEAGADTIAVGSWNLR